jgi:hypothetical protein
MEQTKCSCGKECSCKELREENKRLRRAVILLFAAKEKEKKEKVEFIGDEHPYPKLAPKYWRDAKAKELRERRRKKLNGNSIFTRSKRSLVSWLTNSKRIWSRQGK